MTQSHDNPAPPEAAREACQRARRAVAGLRQDWAERYGEVVCEVDALPVVREGAPAIRLEGQVLVPAQRQALREAVTGVLGGHGLEMAVEALVERGVALGWSQPAGAQVDIRERPDGGLSTQVIAGDPPMRGLARRGDWWAVELADGTVGWARASALAPLAADAAPDSAASWRARWLGEWEAAPAQAWREALGPWLGTPYLWGGSSEQGIDCSGLTQRLYRSVAGIGLPKHSRDQVRAGRRIGRAALAPGDLVFLTHRERRVPHVGIVLEGPGLPVANASFDANAVLVEPLAQMLERYLWRGARRFDHYPEPAGAGPAPRRAARRRQDAAELEVAPPDALRGEDAATATGQAGAGETAGLPAERRAAWQRLEALVDRPVHVVGLASTEGAAILRFLWSLGFRDLTVHDLQAPEAIEAAFMQMHVGLPRAAREAVWRELEALPIERRLGSRYLEGIEGAAVIFAPQAWYLYPANLPKLADLKAEGRPFLGLMGLYFDLAPAGIMAFTGSNGKSTTSRLAETIMRLTEQRCDYAGNERRSVQVLDRMSTMRPEDWLILEVSNRHLKEIAPRPKIGVITNVLPNHLDEHGGSLEAYAAVKERLLARQGPSDVAILNHDNPITRAMADRLPGRVYFFRREGALPRGAWIGQDGRVKLRRGPDEPIVDVGPIDAARIPGAHNQENILAAALATWLAGAPPEAIARGIRMFRGLRHRSQFVWAAAGVRYYDDLNSTTPQATAAALRALPGPISWIAGGQDKGLDYTELAGLAAERCRRVLLLPGEGSERIALALAEHAPRLELLRFETLADAVSQVTVLAEAGETVLLSPACPYFFRMHYLAAGRRERGFKALLREATLRDRAPAGRKEDLDDG